MHKFSDFAEEDQGIDGDRIAIENALNKEIVVKKYRLNKSKFNRGSGKCLTIQLELNGKTNVIFTGSEVLIKQCEKYKDKMPFITQIKKIDKYFTFT